MPKHTEKVDDNLLTCPMPGLVVEVMVQPGKRVFKGQELIILESMKMESAVSALEDGVIESVEVKKGDAVETGTLLISFQ